MPIYEYECPKCGVIEITQHITDEVKKECPNCKSEIKRILSASNFQLKGTGFYETDYKKKQ